jgi:CARDB protein
MLAEEAWWAGQPRAEHRIIEFVVKNIGPTTAGRFHTTVDLGQHLTVPLLTRELPPGDDVSLQVDIPPECFDPDCVITITVDADNAVAEADKGNKVVQVTCPGPSQSPTTATTSSR